MVAPPSVSWYGTPSVRSWSTIEEASDAATPENSGVYDGWDAHRAIPVAPRASTATPMSAMTRWATLKPRMESPIRRKKLVTC